MKDVSRFPTVPAGLAIIASMLVTAATTHGQQRILGLDVSAWQGQISQTTWNNLRNVENRQFVFIRSSRGGTTGEDRRQGGYPSSNNDFYSQSQRYDDPYFVQNVVRASNAGFLVGPYHFSRPDITNNTPDYNGNPTIANTGADEAEHFIQMAGAWMRPGYMLPVHDLEAGSSQRTSAQLSQFALEFSDHMYERMRIRPFIYVSQAYANYVNSSVPLTYPNMWIARYANQADPNSIDVQNENPPPSPSTANVYGKWNPNFTVANPYPDGHPWKFWQYASTIRLQSFNNGGSNLDANVANGGLEFVKDHLVPAVWWNDVSGGWTTMTNWNSGQPAVAPVSSPGQLTPFATGPLPPARLPAGNDTVILDRPNANIVVTLASGSQIVRKLFVREALDITGGALSVSYVPSPDSTPISAQFSEPVSLASNATFNVHTLQVDATNAFTLNGGTLKFNNLLLNRSSTSPATLALNGNVTIAAFSSGVGVVTNGLGSGSSGQITLGGATRSIDVSAGSDISLHVPLSNGGMEKKGPGTLRPFRGSTYAGGTIVSAGKLLAFNTSGSATGSGAVIVNGGVLGGNGIVSGTVTVNSGGTLSPGSDGVIGTLTLNSAPTLGGTNFLEINRDGPPTADKLTLTSGTLTFGGKLVVANLGSAPSGGDVFTLFSAPAYAGAFSSIQLPPLSAGLSWYIGDLNVNGTIKVNRNPLGGLLSVTNVPSFTLEIPTSTLLSVVSDPDGDPVTMLGYAIKSTNNASISSSGGKLIYTSSVNVPDQFHYLIQDNRGGVSTSFVRVAAMTIGAFRKAPTVAASSSTLHFAGAAGSTYYLDRSTNLISWQTIATNVMPQTGIFDYEDLFPGFAQKPSEAFYRLRQ